MIEAQEAQNFGTPLMGITAALLYHTFCCITIFNVLLFRFISICAEEKSREMISIEADADFCEQH